MPARPQQEFQMDFPVRSLAALSVAAALAMSGQVLAQPDTRRAQEANKVTLDNERDRIGYMIGADVGNSLAPVASDMDMAAFERSVRNSFAGGKPLLDEARTRATGEALMARIASRQGGAVPGQPPGAPPPQVSKEDVGLLVGADVGRSLAPIQSEFDLPTFFQGLRTVMANGKPLLSEADTATLRESFASRMQARMQAQAEQAGTRNRAEGSEFLARNKTAKGVFSTGSGLQYMVLRQGSGARPTQDARVRVHYQGALLDGTVFDSSYERGQPTEFGLAQVIAGWTEGLALMPVGAKYRFWIPSELAYGAKGTPGGPIGPNATLVFDVELLGIL
jgi:FKBP-type peptidyl-prolyl cis-trans isomerase FkpA